MIREHPIKEGEQYVTPGDVYDALQSACCQKCNMVIVRNMVNQGYYISSV